MSKTEPKSSRLVRFPKKLLAKVDAQASARGISGNALIVGAVEEALEGPPKPPVGSRLDKKTIGRKPKGKAATEEEAI